MISELIVKDGERAPLKWWKNVPYLKRREKITFKKGLNLVVGPNGSGKSTILTTIARLSCCEQGGVPKLTENMVRNFIDTFGGASDGIRIHTDDQPVFHYDPQRKVGLSGGGFDDDFFLEGFQSAMNRGSTGQEAVNGLMRVIKAAKEPCDPLDFEAMKKRVNPVWQEAIDVLQSCRDTSLPRGPVTILLDEPGRSLDLDLQLRLWRDLYLLCRDGKTQIIAATHNPLILSLGFTDLKGVHVVETYKGFVDLCKGGRSDFAKWIEDGGPDWKPKA